MLLALQHNTTSSDECQNCGPHPPPPPTLTSPELKTLCAGLSTTKLRVEPSPETYRRRYPAYVSGSWASRRRQQSSGQLTRSPEVHSNSPNTHQAISKSSTLVVKTRIKGHLHDADTARVPTTVQGRQADEVADERYYGDDKNTHDDIYLQCPPPSPVNGAPVVAFCTCSSTKTGTRHKRGQAPALKHGQRLRTSQRARPRKNKRSSRRGLERISALMRTRAILLLAPRRRDRAQAILLARLWRESNGLCGSHHRARHLNH